MNRLALEQDHVRWRAGGEGRTNGAQRLLRRRSHESARSNWLSSSWGPGSWQRDVRRNPDKQQFI